MSQFFPQTPQRVHRFVSKDLTIRISSVDATEVVAHMQKLQNTYPVATVGLGRAMAGSLLLASHLGEGQQIGLLFRGAGPIRSLYAEADYEGGVRAYTPEPQYLPADLTGGIKVGEALGIGVLSVSRHLPFQKQPFHGTVELATGEIGEDIAHYLEQSHQIRSLISLGVYLENDGSVKAAGGVLIEVMPGVEESLVEKIQQNMEDLKPSISQMLLSGATAEDLIRPYLTGIDYMEIDHAHQISYSCPCTKDRVLRALETLGKEDLEDMASKGEETGITCQVCGKPYTLLPSELKDLAKSLSSRGDMH